MRHAAERARSAEPSGNKFPQPPQLVRVEAATGIELVQTVLQFENHIPARAGSFLSVPKRLGKTACGVSHRSRQDRFVRSSGSSRLSQKVKQGGDSRDRRPRQSRRPSPFEAGSKGGTTLAASN
jgi:hypothetical protein